VGDRVDEGVTLNNIGAVYYSQARYAEALENYQQALAIRREVGDRVGEAATLANIGAVYRDQTRYAEALDASQQALAISREVGDRAGEGTMLNNIGGVYRSQGRYAEALDTLQQALAIRREVGDRAGEAITLDNIGKVHHAQGRDDEALTTYEQAMAVFDSVRAAAGSEAAGLVSSPVRRCVQPRGRAVPPPGQDDAAFFTGERGRSRAFLDSLATGSVELWTTPRPACWRASRKPTLPVRPARTPWPRPAASTHPTLPWWRTWRRS